MPWGSCWPPVNRGIWPPFAWTSAPDKDNKGRQQGWRWLPWLNLPSGSVPSVPAWFAPFRFTVVKFLYRFMGCPRPVGSIAHWRLVPGLHHCPGSMLNLALAAVLFR